MQAWLLHTHFQWKQVLIKNSDKKDADSFCTSGNLDFAARVAISLKASFIR
jgi:hypothetical protein